MRQQQQQQQYFVSHQATKDSYRARAVREWAAYFLSHGELRPFRLLLFFPKFHCELNFIEMLWGYTKAKLRRMCTFSFSDLKKRLPELLDSIPISFVKRASRHCFRYMDGYRLGLTGPELDYAIRKYKGHRMIPPESLQLINDEFKKQQDDKMRSSFKSC